MAMCTRTLLGDTPPYLQQGRPLSPSAAESISNVILIHHKYWSCLRLLAPELELQNQSKGRMWAQQPAPSTTPIPEARVQVSQSRRTSMWLQQQIPMVNIVEADPQVSQSRRASAWSQQQISFQFTEPDLDNQATESQRGSLWQQEPQSVDPELDVTGQPIPKSHKALWPQEPAPSPLAMLPMDFKISPGSRSLALPSPGTLSASTIVATGPSPRTGTKPRRRNDPGASVEEEGESAASQNLDSRRSTLGSELARDASSSVSSGAGSKVRLSSDEEVETTVDRHRKGRQRCPESARPVPITLGVLHAVTPLKWCPHLEVIRPLPPVGLNVKESCHECGSDSENWVCLTCYKVYCGRYVNEHMMIHGLENDHFMVLSYADLSVWCYGCDSYVHNEVLLPAKSEAHRQKFGVELPTGA
ncbi:protein deacetylase HDAC6-like isoform X2 [Mustelus asterias]